MTYILFILGFFVLIRGAEWLIEGATAVAKKFDVSELVIGMTVVAFGTSLPELIVNLFASSESSELAIGNIVGSNIANVLLVLGVAAVIHPLTVHRKMVYREIIFNVLAAGLVALLVSEKLFGESGFSGLNRIDGLVLMLCFALFLYYTFSKSDKASITKEAQQDESKLDIPATFLKLGAGGMGLYFGGLWIVNGASDLASLFGASEAFIGLTVVAIGTSLPELAASIIAVRHKHVDIAVGNAVGSNLFNIFWVLGLSSFIKPLEFSNDLMVDVGIMTATAALLFGAMFVGKVKHQVGKNEGAVFLAAYASYIIFSIATI